MGAGTMRRLDVLLALVAVTAWGIGFVAVDKGLARLPPLLFVTLRFGLTAFPAVLVVRRPQSGWRVVAALALLMCVGQYGLLFLGMSAGMPAGLASVIMQSQAVFTVLIAAVVLGERPRPLQVGGLALATAGLALIGTSLGSGVPLRALVLLLAGAACWGAANVVTRAARPARPFSLLVYSSLAAAAPLALLSVVTEGAHRDMTALEDLNASVLGSLAFIVIPATLVAFGLWYRLLARYESSHVAPFSLLVPVSGVTAAWIILGERPGWREALGSVVAFVGVGIVVLTRRPAVQEGAAT